MYKAGRRERPRQRRCCDSHLNLHADTPKHSPGVTSRMDTRDYDQEPRLQTVQDLEREPVHETTANAVEHRAGFGKLKKRRQGDVKGANELDA